MRKEQDALGTRELEDDVLFGIHTLRASENFAVSSYVMPKVFIDAFTMVKEAAATTSLSLKMLEENKAYAIINACHKIRNGEALNYLVTDALQGGAGTSTNMNFNEVIANLAIIELGGTAGDYSVISPLDDVNRFQSTNDVYPTALKVASLLLLKQLENSSAILQEELQKKEQEFKNVIKVGRTEFQDAVPMTLGMEFGAFADALSRDRWRIFKCRERIKQVNLGGTAIGTGLAAPREYIFKVVENLRSISGLALSRSENLIDATANSDSFVEVSGMLKAFAANLFKIASDLRVLSSSQYAEITLPAVQAGSSIMPSKINPVIPEMVSQIALKIMANDSLIAQAASLGNMQINQFMPLIAQALLESLELLNNASLIFAEKCIKGITANGEKCLTNFEKSFTLATVLVPILGYNKVSEIVKAAKLNQCTIKEQLLQEKLLSATEIDELMSAQNMYKLGFEKKYE
ncbi:MAG: aspartate ammonia-lyase [Alphaproteobacteria bacterium]